MRDGKLNMNAEITSALLRMIDADRQIFATLDSTGQEGDLDVSGIIQCLTEILTAHEPRIPAPSTKSSRPHRQESPKASAEASDLLGEILVEQGVGRPGRCG